MKKLFKRKYAATYFTTIIDNQFFPDIFWLKVPFLDNKLVQQKYFTWQAKYVDLTNDANTKTGTIQMLYKYY